MKNKTHIGNVVLILDKPVGHPRLRVLMGHKRPKDERDEKRKRQRIGIDRWVPPGGGTEPTDRSQKHAAQREVWQETGLRFPLKAFRKVGVLRGYAASVARPLWLVHIYAVCAPPDNQAFVPNGEYTEMRWFSLSRLPFEQMLPGDREWLPKVAMGQRLTIKITGNHNEIDVFSVKIKPIRSFN